MAKHYLTHDPLSDHKTCPRCLETKPKTEFGICSNTRKSPDGLQGYCKVCMRKAAITSRRKKFADKDPRHFEKNEGQCPICLTVTRLYVDHDHTCCDEAYSCGKCVRGLICSNCNKALGFLLDDVETFNRAITYLKEWELSCSL